MPLLRRGKMVTWLIYLAGLAGLALLIQQAVDQTQGGGWPIWMFAAALVGPVIGAILAARRCRTYRLAAAVGGMVVGGLQILIPVLVVALYMTLFPANRGPYNDSVFIAFFGAILAGLNAMLGLAVGLIVAAGLLGVRMRNKPE